MIPRVRPEDGGLTDMTVQRSRRFRHGEPHYNDLGYQLTDTHTFSTSARPNMPVGRKIRAMMRIENAATSLYSTLK
jgi:hypothetical protein